MAHVAEGDQLDAGFWVDDGLDVPPGIAFVLKRCFWSNASYFWVWGAVWKRKEKVGFGLFGFGALVVSFGFGLGFGRLERKEHVFKCVQFWMLFRGTPGSLFEIIYPFSFLFE